ncbi:increased loss of mitochondrial DNA protein 1 [Fusarium acuminatum]|uniref:Increased loss of mitochondrial DNA protein 1 n=1 Tax=Fusarium acuminatum TaxID=5515 RepID=A0ABZ2WK98_9HYPO
MALISAKTIITSVSLFHLTLGYFFLTNPSSINEQALVYMMGESMGMWLVQSEVLGEANSISSTARSQRLRATKPPSSVPRIHPHLYRLQRPDVPFHARRNLSGLPLGHTRFDNPVDYYKRKANRMMTAPLRSFLSLGFVAYIFLFGPSSPMYDKSSRGPLSHPSAHNPSYRPGGWGGDMLKNRLFFTFIFIETMTWFWVWVTLREERDAILSKKSRRRSQSYSQ